MAEGERIIEINIERNEIRLPSIISIQLCKRSLPDVRVGLKLCTEGFFLQ